MGLSIKTVTLIRFRVSWLWVVVSALVRKVFPPSTQTIRCFLRIFSTLMPPRLIAADDAVATVSALT